MKIYVGNLNYQTGETALRSLFLNYGDVKEVAMKKGFCFVTIEDDAAAEKAIKELNGYVLDGRTIRLDMARGRSKGSGVNAGSGKQTMQTKGKTAGFVNPYNFVHVTEVSENMCCNYGNEGHYVQDHFRHKTHSGRVVCEIETESEMFIGAGTKEDDIDDTKTPAIQEPFTLHGKPALPPSTIKGMLSSIMEAASNSALRVLENQIYTRRMQTRREPLSKIGLLHIQGDKYFIEVLPDDYIYLNSYRYDTTRARFTASGTLSNPLLKDYSVEPIFYYIRSSAITPPRGHYSHPSLKNEKNSLISQNEYESLPPAEMRQYTRGILKHFGVVGRDRDGDIPHTKYHEIFVKYPKRGTYIEVLPRAVNEFNELAWDAYGRDSRMPFYPFERHANPNKPVELRDGDVLYYRTSGSGAAIAVDKLSFSAIWRDFCGGIRQDNDAYGYFKKVDKNGLLLPPCLVNQKGNEPKDLRLTLTPVCSLMGFVEEKPLKEGEPALALAGRLFFSPGVLSPGQNPENVRLPEKTLKELASPKPPCPEFYFHRKTDTESSTFITKENLKPNGDFIPNGRKFYWHHHDDNDPYAPDEEYTRNHYKRIVTVEPIKKGTKFLFSIDFFNLTDFELGMLLYALRPNETFRHQMGMGKPLGMGQIKVDILNLLFIDRQLRYGDDPLFSPGLFHAQTGTKTSDLETLTNDFADDERGIFNRERYCPSVHVEHEKATEDFTGEFKKKITKEYGPDWLIPLETIGYPDATDLPDIPVQYPNLAKGGLAESYKWWMRNSDKVRGKMKPLPQVPNQPGKKAGVLPFDPSH